LNTLIQRIFFLVFLGSALLSLPACGSKSTVNSQKPNETVLNPEATPVSSGDFGNTPVNTYVEKVGHKKSSKSSSQTIGMASTISSSTAAATTQNTPNNTPVMETAAPPVKKGGHSSWLWWILLVLILAGIGWYFWSKNQPDEHPAQPMPPVGGLSPVSGFTAVKDQIEDESSPEPSFWTRKIF
jgi:hypothetical protein